jgi:hypothetical protein
LGDVVEFVASAVRLRVRTLAALYLQR